MADPLLPFFIARDPGIADPSGSDAGPGGITWVEVGGEAARLAEWLGGADLPVRVVEDGGGRGVRRSGSATANCGEGVARPAFRATDENSPSRLRCARDTFPRRAVRRQRDERARLGRDAARWGTTAPGTSA